MIGKMCMKCKKDFIQLFSDLQFFYPCWKMKYGLFPDQLNLLVWLEDPPVLHNLIQSPKKDIKFIRFCQIQKVKASRSNLCLKHKLSIQNAERAIYLQLGGTILLILIFILNFYNFIWKILGFLKCHFEISLMVLYTNLRQPSRFVRGIFKWP